jgi:serine/threonine protein kinase
LCVSTGIHQRHRYSTGETVAVKLISLEEGDEALDDVRNEISFLRDCSHPNVVKYYGSYFKDEHLWV